MNQNNHEKKIELTIDFPFEKYVCLKALADQKEISIQRYIVEFLCANLEKELDLRKIKFKEAMDKVLREKDDTLRKLADS